MSAKRQVYGPGVMFTLLFMSFVSLLPLSARAAGMESTAAAAENQAEETETTEAEAAETDTTETGKPEAAEAGKSKAPDTMETGKPDPAETEGAQNADFVNVDAPDENTQEMLSESRRGLPELPEPTKEELEAFSEEEAEAYRQLKAAYELMEEQWLFIQEQISLTGKQLQTLSPGQETAARQTAPGQLLIQLSTALSEQEAQAAQTAGQIAGLLENIRRRQEEQRKKGPEIIFVGDSRFVQMQDAVGDNSYVWIARVSQGYQWLSEEAVSRIDEEVGYGTKILLNLGVNDTVNASSYIRLVNRKAEEWTDRGAQVYYASVNPVEDGRYVTVKMVRDFNTKLKAGLNPEIHWIDSYSFLQKTGYHLTDGLHYGNDTYKRLYRYYLNVLEAEDKGKKG